MLASLDVTMLVEFQVPDWDSELTSQAFLLMWVPRLLKFFYYISIVYAFMCNLKVVSNTTILAVMGTSLALRGPDGSMIVATEGLYTERAKIFKAFGNGLLFTIFASVFACFLLLHWETALVSAALCILTGREIMAFYGRVRKNFDFDENTEAIDLSDIFAGPANIVAQSSQNLNRALMRANGIRNTSGVPAAQDEEASSLLRMV